MVLWLKHSTVLGRTLHMSSSDYCSCYNENLFETILHALRDCSVLGDFWLKIVPLEDWPKFSIATLHRWLYSNLRSQWLLYGYSWAQVFGYVLYFLWLMHNEEIFQHSTPSSEILSQHFWLFFSQNQVSASMLDSSSIRLSKHLAYICWSSPSDP